MTINSLASSTREAFAAKAGIACKTGTVIATENCFIVATPDDNRYVARFRRNGGSVEYFHSPTLGRALTREEARDLLAIIKTCAAHSDLRTHFYSIVRLEQNLPSLGFDRPTPLMTEQIKPTPRREQNAKLWSWSLV